MPTSKGLVKSVENGNINLYAVSQNGVYNIRSFFFFKADCRMPC